MSYFSNDVGTDVAAARELARKEVEALFGDASKGLGVKLLDVLVGSDGLMTWAAVAEKAGLGQKLELKCKDLEPLRDAFSQSLVSVALLLHAPRAVVTGASLAFDMTYGMLLSTWVEMAFREMVKSNILRTLKGGKGEKRAKAKQLEEFLDKVFEKKQETVEDTLKLSLGTAEGLRSQLFENEHVQAWRQANLGAVLVRAWTSFEAFVGDAWIYVLNARSKQLASRAFSQIPEGQDDAGGLSRKSIQIGILSKFELNLDGRLGTALKGKFDFSCISGIRTALKVIDASVDWDATGLKSKILQDLEATRHLLVHQAGRVDEQFKLRTGSALEVGQHIELAESDVDNAVLAVIAASKKLLGVLDDWLSAN